MATHFRCGLRFERGSIDGHEVVLVGAGARALVYLTEEDGTGFAFATVSSGEGIETGTLHYPHHVKANYVLEGSGTIVSQDGQRWPLEPGSFYVVGPDDPYR